MSTQAISYAIADPTPQTDATAELVLVGFKICVTLTEDVNDLARLVPGSPDYQWHSKANLEEAHSWFEALVQAHQERNTEMVNVSAGWLADYYNKDRAERCASLLNVHGEPLREIPSNKRARVNGNERTVSLCTRKIVDWYRDIPLYMMPTVAKVIKQATPDHLMLADYQYYSVYRDRLLYAQYSKIRGNWFVKLAEWK